MKIKLNACSLLFLGLHASTVLWSSQIVWNEKFVKLTGSQLQDEIKFVYSFSNSGNHTVFFTQTKASCGCTIPTLEKKEYKPGEKGELKGTYSLRGHHGLNSVLITVNAEELDGDVRRPLSDTLKLQVFIPEIVSVSPSISLWKKDSAAIEKTIRLEVKQTDALTLKLASLNNDHFTAELVEDFPGRIYNLIVKPTSTADPITGMAIIEGVTSDGKTAKFFAHFIVK